MLYIILYSLIIFNLIPGFYSFYSYESSNTLGLNPDNDLPEGYENKSNSAREKRFLFIFPFYRLLPGNPCTSSTNLQGICLSQRQCNARGGTCSGNCGNRGVCCVFQRSCGTSTNANITYFTHPNYPSPFGGGGSCTLTINKLNTGICQLRLDFLEFSLAEPTSAVDRDSSECRTDSMNLGNNLPTICGVNDQPGQHVYIDFNPSSTSHTLTINTAAGQSMNKRWNIRVTQIACNSSTRAPSGCLKYYTSVQGSDYSFNYSPSNPTQVPTPGNMNRQLANLNYGVCVRPEAGFCSIQWSAASTTSFSVSGIGTTTQPSIGIDCTANYIVVPNPNGLNIDRFCGTSLSNPLETSARPYVLTVVTASASTVNTANSNTFNRGFQLNFLQMPCNR